MRKYYILDMDGTLCGSMEYWRLETAMVDDFSDVKQIEPAFAKMREHYRDSVKLKDGVLEFLENARSRGIKMCIATGTRRDVAQPFLDKTGIMDFMEFYIDCFDVRAFKEKPDIYLRAAELFKASAAECAVFEDAEYSAATARNAGFFVVGIHDDVAAREGNTRAYSDLFLESWRDFNWDI